MNFGYSFIASWKDRYITVVINGRIFTFGKGTQTGKYRLWYHENVWRKTDTPMPETEEIATRWNKNNKGETQ